MFKTAASRRVGKRMKEDGEVNRHIGTVGTCKIDHCQTSVNY